MFSAALLLVSFTSIFALGQNSPLESSAFVESASRFAATLPEVHLSRLDELEYSLKPSVQAVAPASHCSSWTRSRKLINEHLQKEIVKLAKSEEAQRGDISPLMQLFLNPPRGACLPPATAQLRLESVNGNASAVVAAHQAIFDAMASQSQQTVSPLWEQLTEQADTIAPGSSLKERQRALIRRLRDSMMHLTEPPTDSASTRRRLTQVGFPALSPDALNQWAHQFVEHMSGSHTSEETENWTEQIESGGPFAAQFRQLTQAVNRTTSFFVFIGALRTIVASDAMLSKQSSCLVASVPRTCGATLAAAEPSVSADETPLNQPPPSQTSVAAGKHSGSDPAAAANISYGGIALVVVFVVVATNAVTLVVVRYVHKQKLQARASNPFAQIPNDEVNDSPSTESESKIAVPTSDSVDV